MLRRKRKRGVQRSRLGVLTKSCSIAKRRFGSILRGISQERRPRCSVGCAVDSPREAEAGGEHAVVSARGNAAVFCEHARERLAARRNLRKLRRRLDEAKRRAHVENAQDQVRPVDVPKQKHRGLQRRRDEPHLPLLRMREKIVKRAPISDARHCGHRGAQLDVVQFNSMQRRARAVRTSRAVRAVCLNVRRRDGALMRIDERAATAAHVRRHRRRRLYRLRPRIEHAHHAVAARALEQRTHNHLAPHDVNHRVELQHLRREQPSDLVKSHRSRASSGGEGKVLPPLGGVELLPLLEQLEDGKHPPPRARGVQGMHAGVRRHRRRERRGAVPKRHIKESRAMRRLLACDARLDPELERAHVHFALRDERPCADEEGLRRRVGTELARVVENTQQGTPIAVHAAALHQLSHSLLRHAAPGASELADRLARLLRAHLLHVQLYRLGALALRLRAGRDRSLAPARVSAQNHLSLLVNRRHRAVRAACVGIGRLATRCA
mmetsp:Transcript_43006/g.89836  ORF Transcript_43006/g.89836 Transcript_43006/m.89836 type:complete len:495 (+) Transcript_43006:1131-2615(+)